MLEPDAGIPDLLTITSTYCGPPGSAHGGVAVGRVAGLVAPGPVEVRLLAPPPLDTPLTSRAEGDGSAVVAGPGGDVARVRSLREPLEIAPFGLVSDAEVDRAAEMYLRDVADNGHVFSTCFGCGPDRHDDEALRQFPGQASDGATVARFRVDGVGAVPDWLTLAGLDCPSGITVGLAADEPPEAMVLGTMQCQLHRQAERGVDYQVRGRLREVSGRKHTSEVAMLAPDGSLLAEARAVWIAVDPAVFGVT